MAREVAIYQIKNHHRSRVICEAMAAGVKACGWVTRRFWEDEYREPVAAIAVFYGLEGRCPALFEAYRRSGSAVYMDLGYWGRREGGRWTGYHKAVINARHPSAYFQKVRHRPDRFGRFGIVPAPWRPPSGPGHILLAGMGEKGAVAEGLRAEEWERDAIEQLRRHSQRPIIYRAKPSWKKARPIEGVGFSPRDQDVDKAIAGAWAIVTHHSNIAIDGLLRGIPALCLGGVAAALSGQRFEDIERLPRPEGRFQWCADLAYTQWSVREMAEGACWRHFLEEGLLT